ncbi:trifunctional udp-glucose 4 [Anaeramoeba flamelloides]|uniref:Trifunctional udp-glucose 4 n=1 Tax=Anaeramoeba flamelloides TaxID=1746091 RepID=A0ABQ8Y599_9EUKA|nr:trifunctional udp-glucose 4 [Anaeramoeba flamelloides]
MSSVFLVFGSTGYIGKRIVSVLEKEGATYYCAKSRLENRNDIIQELEEYQPTNVINAAGVVGKPNVDWCEDHKQEVQFINVTCTLSLAHLCHTRGIHLTQLGTGCIYEYDGDHQPRSGKCFTELDKPNFDGSFYSKTKAIAEELLKTYLDNTLVLRIRMPITSDPEDKRSLVSKLINYEKVIDIPNSMTILQDMLPILVDMSKKKITGIFNFTNPGAFSHNQVLSLYKKYIDNDFTWKNFTVEEQDKILTARRSNNELNVNKLLGLYPKIPNVEESMISVFKQMKKNIELQKK